MTGTSAVARPEPATGIGPAPRTVALSGPTVAVIGCGRMGSALAAALDRLGNRTLLVSRPGSGAASKLSRALHFAEACAATSATLVRADILFLTIPSDDIDSGLAEALRTRTKGRVVVDVSNPSFGRGADPAGSNAERIARAMPDAHVVKALNCVPAAMIGDPVVDGRRITVPVAADHPGARVMVSELLCRLGFDPVDAGRLGNSVWLEALTELMLAMDHAEQTQGRVGFVLARDPPASPTDTLPAAIRK